MWPFSYYKMLANLQWFILIYHSGSLQFNCFVCFWAVCLCARSCVCLLLFLLRFQTISKNWGFPVNCVLPCTHTNTQYDWCVCFHDNNRAIRYILAIHTINTTVWLMNFNFFLFYFMLLRMILLPPSPFMAQRMLNSHKRIRLL